jgi:hypothetical protein
MGDCFVAVADDATACYWNPGGLDMIEGNLSATLLRTELVPDWGDVWYWYGAATYRPGTWGTLGASVTYLDYGEQMATDAEGNILYSFESSELVLSAAYGIEVLDGLGVGVNVKHIALSATPDQWVSGGDGIGSTWGLDIGALYRRRFRTGPLDSKLGLGLALQHLGPDFPIDGTIQPPGWPRPIEYDPSQPAKVKAGVSYGVSTDDRFSGLLCFEYEKHVDDERYMPVLHYGAELGTSFTALAGRRGDSTGIRDRVAVRAGYVHNESGQITDWSYGAGLTLMHPSGIGLVIDFANVPQAPGLTRPWRGGTGLALRVELDFGAQGLWPDESAAE